MTSIWLVSRTRHTFLRAEFGFFGVVVYTRRQTPRFCGHERRAGDAVRMRKTSRPERMSWLIVGIGADFPLPEVIPGSRGPGG